MRGGEKVLENICRAYPNADIFTHVYNKNNISKIITSHNIRTTFINKLPFSRYLYKYYLLLMPYALKKLDLKKYDLIISCESGPSKGVIKNKNSYHVCYCHTPMRYLYDMRNEYLKKYNFLSKKIINSFFNYLKKWDYMTSQKIDLIISNSEFVSNRIKKYWNRNSIIINPTINLDEFSISKSKKSYYIVLSELVSYKRIDIAIEAFNKNKKELYIVGSGSLLNKFKRISKKNIRFLDNVSDMQKISYLSNAQALIFPGIEDFGITPLESLASGTPVIAFKDGGVLDYLKENENAIFFNKQTSNSLNRALVKFEENKEKFSPDSLRKTILEFSDQSFINKLKKIINKNFKNEN
jgi:glycosyltransferase involved in cell wall biosynthesis